jgi:hypothetical protein
MNRAKRVLCGVVLWASACTCGDSSLHRGGPDGGTDGGADGGNPPCMTLLCGAMKTCCPAGDSCIQGACAAACASAVRCAASCCDAGQVCAGMTCATPTTPCSDSVDCAGDEYCEPTLGRCLPDVPGNVCKLTRPSAPLTPTSKWSFTTPVVKPSFDQTLSAPLVVDIPSGGMHHSAVFVTTSDAAGAGGGAYALGYLRRLDGLTGIESWPASVDALQPNNEVEATFSPAVGDIDSDGVVDIVTMAATGELIAFDANGALKWRSQDPVGAQYFFPIVAAAPMDPMGHPLVASTIALADMDGDGQVETIFGGAVFNSHGRLIAGAAHPLIASISGVSVSSIVADVDGDGKQEVLAGNAAWKLDNTALWQNAMTPDGFPAIADFEKDGVPELVVTTATPDLRVLNAKTGEVLATIALAGASGSPVVADFSGAGPEIGVQHGTPGGCAVSVFHYENHALTKKWSHDLTVCSGLLTATAFDFNGDGKVEVIAHDDCRILVLDGPTGAQVELTMPASHATWTEFVSVVDVDGNGVADLLFSTNDAFGNGPAGIATYCSYTGTEAASHGVFVFSDPAERWMPTRRVWNQQAYHITNIRSDGTLPPHETQSWSPAGYNNYRVSAQTKGTAPDFVVSLGADLSMCPDALTLVATVANAGTQGAPAGVTVDFSSGGTLLGSAMTTMALLPGATQALTFTVSSPPGSAMYQVTVDGMGAVAECNATNDTDALTAGCPAIQ